MNAKHSCRLMRHVHDLVRFLAFSSEGGGRQANRSHLSNRQRLFLVAALITAEILCG